MSIKHILTAFATLLEEIAIVLIVLLVLPRFGIYIPLPGFIALMVGLGVWGVISYRAASQTLRKKPMVGLPAMVGSKGKVISSLAPNGVIKIRDELWEAISDGHRIDTGQEVIVVKQRGLKLVVRKSTTDDLKGIK